MMKKWTIISLVTVALIALSGSGVMGAQVLVVDDDGSTPNPENFTDVRADFTDALDACGYTYDVHDVLELGIDGPDHTVMQNYEAVVWFTGEAWQLQHTLTPTDEAELALYLDGGSNLFLSAQDYLWDRYPSAGSFSPGQFPYDYLGVTYTWQDICYIGYPSTGHADGYAGSVAAGLSYDLWDPYTTKTGGGKKPDGLFIDDLDVLGDAVFQVTSPDPVTIAACQYEGAKGFKTVFTTVSFGGLIDAKGTKAELMLAIMEWFDIFTPVELASFTAIAGDRVVSLNWETRSELNNLGFDVYRRVEGEEFVRINAERIPGAGSSELAHSYTYVDRGLTNGAAYYYKIADIDFDGNVRLHDIVVSATPTAVLPKTFELSQNYPNPFNPNTEIKYQIPRDSRVTLKIYNAMGQEIISLVDADLKAGYYTATWNARDAQGVEVSAGVYFCVMKAGEFSLTRKMALIK